MYTAFSIRMLNITLLCRFVSKVESSFVLTTVTKAYIISFFLLDILSKMFSNNDDFSYSVFT